MRNCPTCGTELPDKARFCSHCGEAQSTSTAIDRATNSGNSPPADMQPIDVSAIATQSLTNNSEKEKAQASILPSSTFSEKQRTQFSQQPEKEDKGGWLIAAIIALVLIVGVVSAWTTLLSSHSAGTGSTPNAASNRGGTPTASTCSGATSSTCSTATIIPTSIVSNGTADLTFSGAVVGHMTTSMVVTCGSDQSVAGGMQYHVAVFGTVSGRQYALTFGVYPYTSPNTYTSSVFSFFGPAGSNSSIAQWRSTPNLDVSVTINSDGKSGTLDIGYLSSSDKSTAHVSGSWKCA
jgi:zinc-ribbon domain